MDESGQLAEQTHLNKIAMCSRFSLVSLKDGVRREAYSGWQGRPSSTFCRNMHCCPKTQSWTHIIRKECMVASPLTCQLNSQPPRKKDLHFGIKRPCRTLQQKRSPTKLKIYASIKVINYIVGEVVLSIIALRG
jgi:hypothetical protein